MELSSAPALRGVQAPPADLAEARRRIARYGHLNAFISLSEEQGEGAIVAVKDLIDVAGTVTTGGGRILPDVPAAEDAPVIATLRAQSCVFVGKTNLHEWAFGSSSINPHYGAVRNPFNPELSGGGSSGGSAVAVACGMCHWAIGTDTAGSLRIPASVCGIVSIKPTYGSIPNDGVIPLSRSLDTVGPMAQDVSTAASALSMMTAGSIAGPASAPARVRDMRIARAPDHWVLSPDDPTGRAWEAVASAFPELEVPDRLRASEICTTISMYEASRFHQQWLEERPDAYGDQDVRQRLEAGLAISAQDYEQALGQRDMLADEFDEALSGWDALLAPATAWVAQPIKDGPDVREPMTRFTRPFAATGQPVVTIPAPVTGRPVGIQVISRRGEDVTAVGAAMALEAEWR